ncbi:MAG TPA: cysteine hydrolase [Candidatus Binatia bacterium]|nr:cysteine hydrolase [Candidatus Binatia bacterium]
MKLKRAALAAGCLILAVGGCERATTGEPIPIYDRPQVALLVVDLQKHFLDRGGRQALAPSHVAAMLAATNRLVENARSLGVELVYVRSEAPAGDGTDSRLENPGAPVFRKQRADAFSNPELDQFLRSRAVDHLVLAGASAEASIYYTAEGAMNRGYKVKVLGDAVAAASDARRDHALEALRREGAELSDSEQVLAEWVRRKKYLGSR